MRDRIGRRKVTALILSTLVSITTAAAAAAGPVAPVVPGYVRLKALEKVGGDAAAGELLLSELNCTACHAPGDGAASRVASKGAPDLAGIGSRVTPQWLRAYLTDPHGIKPGATMPDI